MKNAPGENQGTAIARAVVYRFLSRCFSHPDADLFELFEGVRLQEFLQAWQCLGLDAGETVAGITSWLAQFPGRDTTRLELDKEYTRLFVAAYPKVVAPPYSSIYLNEGLVWGQSTSEVIKLYKSAGLDISIDFHDIPDHIAAELEFLSYLILEQQRVDRADTGLTGMLASVEKQFLADHFLRWTPSFLSRVVENSRCVFYSGIARLSLIAIDHESRHINGLSPA